MASKARWLSKHAIFPGRSGSESRERRPELVRTRGRRSSQSGPGRRHFCAPSFFMILARWSSMVRGLIPRWRPASLLEAPAVNCSSTSRSRRVSGSRPGKCSGADIGSGAIGLPARIGLDRLVEPRHDVIAAKRLLDEIQRAMLDRADSHGDIALPGDDEDRRRIVLAAQFLQDIQTGFAGNMHVQKNASGSTISRDRQQRSTVGKTDDFDSRRPTGQWKEFRGRQDRHRRRISRRERMTFRSCDIVPCRQKTTRTHKACDADRKSHLSVFLRDVNLTHK